MDPPLLPSIRTDGDGNHLIGFCHPPPNGPCGTEQNGRAFADAMGALDASRAAKAPRPEGPSPPLEPWKYEEGSSSIPLHPSAEELVVGGGGAGGGVV